MFLILNLFIAIILTEAITEIVTKSEIFRPLKALFFKLGKDSKFFNWLHSLFDCGYCFSVWSGSLIAILFFREINLVHITIDWFIIGIVLHRMSNIIHNLIDITHNIDI